MIDEKKLIEDLKKHFDALYKEDGTLLQSDHICISEDVEDIIKFINEQPKTDWIPCEVELPKTNGVYQVIREIKEGEVTYHIPTASYFDGQNTWHNDICVNFGRQNEQNVIAWQPIQPYKKEGAENE